MYQGGTRLYVTICQVGRGGWDEGGVVVGMGRLPDRCNDTRTFNNALAVGGCLGYIGYSPVVRGTVCVKTTDRFYPESSHP